MKGQVGCQFVQGRANALIKVRFYSASNPLRWSICAVDLGYRNIPVPQRGTTVDAGITIPSDDTPEDKLTPDDQQDAVELANSIAKENKRQDFRSVRKTIKGVEESEPGQMFSVNITGMDVELDGATTDLPGWFRQLAKVLKKEKDVPDFFSQGRQMK